jgi:PAS domain S-box-containing protein
MDSAITIDIEQERQPFLELRAFLQAVPDAALILNTDGWILFPNQLAEKLFGYPPGELAGLPLSALIPESLLEEISHLLAKPPELITNRLLTGQKKDRSEFQMEMSFNHFEMEAKPFLFAIVRDTSSRFKAEAKFRGLLESAPDGIIVVGKRGQITIANTQVEKMFGYSRHELIGQSIEILVPERYHGTHIHDRESYTAHPRTRPMGAGRYLTGRKKDGTEFPVEISLSPMETEQGILITSIIRDITDRRQAEEQIKASLREKEVLLKEIHHRVKNNLQVTSSLLKLQSTFIEDPQAREMFADSQNRIRSMALVHEKLYRSSDLSRINFSEYVESLAALLFRSYGVNSNLIKLQLSGENVFLSIENAVPCGLILNELLSNCLKHAFPNGRGGEIRVQIGHTPERLILNVADNGIGLPKDLNIETTETLGLQLVRTLTRQLSGELQVQCDGWTEFKINCLIGKSS